MMGWLDCAVNCRPLARAKAWNAYRRMAIGCTCACHRSKAARRVEHRGGGVTFATPETHLQYAQRVGPPRVVACDIDLRGHDFLWHCRPHDYSFNDRAPDLHGVGDRCPMSRLEEWRARKWAAVDDGDYGTTVAPV